MLIRNVRERGGPGKLRSFWEQKVYRVCERKEGSPVYVVEPERGGEKRTVHRNMLFHCGDELPDEPEESDIVCQQTKEASKPKAKVPQNHVEIIDNDSDVSSNSDEEESVQKHRNSRIRNRPTRLNYKHLGKPAVNSLTVIRQNNYRTWLEQLWTLGYWTNLLIKQQYSTVKPLYISHPCK